MEQPQEYLAPRAPQMESSDLCETSFELESAARMASPTFGMEAKWAEQSSRWRQSTANQTS